MRKILSFTLLFLCSYLSFYGQRFATEFEKSDGLETATYAQTISYYKALEKEFNKIKIQEVGKTDSGLPLHLVIFGCSEINDKKQVLLINNGIHPGESDGIDATMMLFRDLALGKIKTEKNTLIATIPIYNIGGSLNRNSFTRTNQNGPKEYGFRGNSRNFDLNRDFIKSDTKNSKAFYEVFHLLKPDIFIDNHVSNGANYQYTLTHLLTQHNKLGGQLGLYLNKDLRPKLEFKLKKKQWDVTPYVNVFNQVPETGFSQFLDTPRYSTGYTTLFNTLGLMVETHMLKPYKSRVNGTYELMKTMIEILEEDGEKIKEVRKQTITDIYDLKEYNLNWEVDSSKKSKLSFKGFEGSFVKSNITEGTRLKFDSSKPFEKEIDYFDSFKPTIKVEIPKAYIIPKGWWNIIELLQLNDVKMTELKSDTTLMAESYRIQNYNTRKTPYEGHYSHFNTQIKAKISKTIIKKGDYWIETKQPAIRYLLETLEPEASDSFFNWNFFDTILQQKEGFSPYVWEDMAEQYLNENLELQKEFELKKKNDSSFSENWYAQLDWLHKKSKNYEKSHLHYPILRILK